MHDGVGYVSHTKFVLHDVVEEDLTLNPRRRTKNVSFMSP
jgi:hypothetical protein